MAIGYVCQSNWRKWSIPEYYGKVHIGQNHFEGLKSSGYQLLLILESITDTSVHAKSRFAVASISGMMSATFKIVTNMLRYLHYQLKSA